MKFMEKIFKVAGFVLLVIMGLNFMKIISTESANYNANRHRGRNAALEDFMKETHDILLSFITAGQNNDDSGVVSKATIESDSKLATSNFDTSNEISRNEFSLPLILPVEGDIKISSGFGARRDPFTGRNTFHNGIDIPLPKGTMVRSTGNGFVARTGYSSRLGKFITINHGSSYESIYGHLSDIRVQSGQTVQMGQTIAYSGNTGRSKGPHLHYQINYKGQPKDPIEIKRTLNQ